MSSQTGHGRLQGRIAIVTGGASSIGRAICLAYAAEGAIITVADLRETSRDEKETTATHALIKERGGQATFHQVDVTDSASVDKLVEDTVKAHGRLDIMVNNAGIAPPTCPIWETPDDLFDQNVAVNGRGVFLGIKAASRQMIKQDPLPSGDRGWIVNTASIYGLIATANGSPYIGSKHLCMGLTRAAALDCAPHSIHVNAICPGWIYTPLISKTLESMPEAMEAVKAAHPFGGGRFGNPADIAPLAVMLASDDARWMTGQGYVVDGGFSAQ